MTWHFIDQFRNARAANDSDMEKKVALMSGRSEAADFIQQLLTDTTLDAFSRDRPLTERTPRGDGSFNSIRRLPVSDSLGSTAMLLVHSEDLSEWLAGAGLFGGVRTSASRNELLRLLQDPNSIVKKMAVRSVGLLGDATTRKILETDAAQTADPSLQKAAAAAIKDLDRQ